jgi:hypothetical protein
VEQAQINVISLASNYKKEYNQLLEELFKEVPSLQIIECYSEKLNTKYKQLEKLVSSTIMTPTLAEIYSQFLKVIYFCYFYRKK